VRKICDEVECWQFSTDALDCQRPKRPSWRNTVFLEVRINLRVGYAEVIFIQPNRKLDTMWRDAWQRLASSYTTSRWDVAVNLMVTVAERCSLSHRQKHTNLQLVNCSSLSQTFCSPNSPVLDTVNCHLGCNSVEGLPSSRLLLSWQN